MTQQKRRPEVQPLQNLPKEKKVPEEEEVVNGGGNDEWKVKEQGPLKAQGRTSLEASPPRSYRPCFKCHTCGKEFPRRFSRKRHEIRFHGFLAPSDEEGEAMKDQGEEAAEEEEMEEEEEKMVRI